MWSGEFHFGDLWSAYVGPAADNTPHAHVAVQVTLAFDLAPSIQLGDERICAPAIIVGPLVRHRLAPVSSPVMLVYLEPRAALAVGLLESIAPQKAAAAPASLSLGRNAGETPAQWIDRATRVLGVKRKPLDPRLDAVLDQAAADRAPGAIGRAAKAAGLSQTRLRAVSKSQLGVSVSQCLLWRKLAASARAIARGESLAEAALSGGFADQAHLARTMRRMFGVTPSAARPSLASQSALRAQ